MSMIEPRPSGPAGIGRSCRDKAVASLLPVAPHALPGTTGPALAPDVVALPGAVDAPDLVDAVDLAAGPGLAGASGLPVGAKDRRAGPRWFLRDATADLHEVADTLGGGFDLSTTADYARFLRAHARALLPLETALASAGIEDFLPDWPSRRRGAALLADLAALGEAVPAAPRFRLHTAAAALGAAYVLEGSRMGNGLLLRGLAATGRPVAYLGHAGADGGWPGFLLRLEDALRLPDLWPAAAEGARAAFSLFLAAMRQEAAEPRQA